MKKLLIVIVIICSLWVAALAQEPIQYQYAIKIEQDFDSWNKCSGGYPHLDEMTVTIGNSNAGVNKGEISKEEGNGRYKGSFTKLVKKGFGVVKVEDKTRGLGRKGNTFTYNDSIQEEELRIGVNKNIRNTSDAYKCSMFHREGYSISTSITLDNPIDIEIAQKNTIIVESEKLELQFNEFYENGTKIELQYRCINAGIEEWQPISNKSISIRSGGTLRLFFYEFI